MTNPSPRPSPHSPAAYDAALTKREADLRALLHAAEQPVAAENASEVGDFKDLAAVEAQSEVDENRSTLAQRELEQVLAARRRMENGTYGVCADCGDFIGEERLLALPEALCCTACQSTHERPHGRPVLSLSKAAR